MHQAGILHLLVMLIDRGLAQRWLRGHVQRQRVLFGDQPSQLDPYDRLDSQLVRDLPGHSGC